MTARARSVRLRAYRVGFGDCLLLTVTYGSALGRGRGREGHLLVDFGTKVAAEGGPRLAQVAERIREHCGGVLDAVVATHRHQDHVSGFGDERAMRALGDLEPSVVIRPWTDIPTDRAPEVPGLGAGSRDFLALLDTVADQAGRVGEAFALDRTAAGRRARELADLGVRNARAVATLETWAGDDRGRWVKAGDTVDVGLPDVTVRVLGPPTMEQVPGLRHYASSSAEYWLGLAAEDRLGVELAPPGPAEEALGLVAEPGGLGAAAWLLDTLRDSASRQVLGIVDGFDEVLNNTSLVLLVTVGRRTLLLAGDAQVENWSFALDRALADTDPDTGLRAALAGVDVYKVGHHGSRNATPRRLHRLWATERRADHHLTSVLSTRRDVFGGSRDTEVPQGRLLTGLAQVGPVHSTDDLPEGVWWFDVEADVTRAGSRFAYAEGPVVR